MTSSLSGPAEESSQDHLLATSSVPSSQLAQDLAQQEHPGPDAEADQGDDDGEDDVGDHGFFFVLYSPTQNIELSRRLTGAHQTPGSWTALSSRPVRMPPQ